MSFMVFVPFVKVRFLILNLEEKIHWDGAGFVSCALREPIDKYVTDQLQLRGNS